jgi:HEAT repeat protein
VSAVTPGDIPSPPDPEPTPERQTTPFLVLQFFIFPMAIVAVCVTVFVVFGLISSDARTPRQYLAEARTGGGVFNIKRWQAAHALANALESPKDLAAVRQDPAFVKDTLALYHESGGTETGDVLLRRYLALVLGKLGDAEAVPDLRQTVKQEQGGDAQTVIYAAWALGSIRDPAALPELLELAQSSDAGFRKAAVHALGAFKEDAARDAVRAALKDAADDVRWNAALALGRRGDAAAAPVLAEMLDRERLAKVAGLTPEQKEDVLLEAVRSAGQTPDPSLRPLLTALRDGDPNLKLRDAARAALEGGPK